MRSTKPEEEDRMFETLRLYRREHMTQAEAYMATHPDCAETTAKKKASAYIKSALKALSRSQLLELYDLGFERYLRELSAHLEGKKPLSNKGFLTGQEEPDNQMRSAALKQLGQLNGVGEQHRTEITADGDEGLHIVIDNG